MKYNLTAGDYFARRGPVIKHKEGKAPVDCRFCRHGCNRYTYYTWHNRETKRYDMRPMPICFDCAAKLEKWADILAEKFIGTDTKLDDLEILPTPCHELREIMLEMDREAQNAG